MMNIYKPGSEQAVSPVVGVMLMLVVTIIIAALVSAFAGGMANSQKAAPSMVLEGTYSQSTGMTISHAGGDPIALSKVQFRTVPSDLFGVDAEKFAASFPNYIMNTSANSPVVNMTTGFYHKPSFISGDVLIISHGYCTDYQTDTYLAGFSKTNQDKNTSAVNGLAYIQWPDNPSNPSGKEAYFRAYQFGNPANIGKYFYLDMLDPTGNLITRAKVTITS